MNLDTANIILKATTPTPEKAPKAAPRTMTAIERTEAAIASGDCEPTLAYRVYELTTSVAHLQAGADFMLVESFNNALDAELCRDERMESGFAVCVIVH